MSTILFYTALAVLVSLLFLVRKQAHQNAAEQYQKGYLKGILAASETTGEESVWVDIRYRVELFDILGNTLGPNCSFGSCKKKEQVALEKSAIEKWVQEEFGIAWRMGRPLTKKYSVPKDLIETVVNGGKQFSYSMCGYAHHASKLVEYLDVTRRSTVTVTIRTAYTSSSM